MYGSEPRFPNSPSAYLTGVLLAPSFLCPSTPELFVESVLHSHLSLFCEIAVNPTGNSSLQTHNPRVYEPLLTVASEQKVSRIRRGCQCCLRCWFHTWHPAEAFPQVDWGRVILLSIQTLVTFYVIDIFLFNIAQFVFTWTGRR